jgi:hypothetical protein
MIISMGKTETIASMEMQEMTYFEVVKEAIAFMVV